MPRRQVPARGFSERTHLSRLPTPEPERLSRPVGGYVEESTEGSDGEPGVLRAFLTTSTS